MSQIDLFKHFKVIVEVLSLYINSVFYRPFSKSFPSFKLSHSLILL